MTVHPFTYKEAQTIAASFKYLVGKLYFCPEIDLVCKIRTVGVLPFFEYDKVYLSHMYMCLMQKVEGYSVDSLIDFIVNNKLDVFDVVLTSCPTESDKIMMVKSIDVINSPHGIEYSFNIDLL